MQNNAAKIFIKRDMGSWTQIEAHQIRYRVKSIACGYSHTMIMTENNELFARGSNDKHQCGIEDSSKSQIEFTSVPRGDSESVGLESIHCGGYSSYFLSENGQLFGVGSSIRTLKTITRLNLDNLDSKIVSLACGYDRIAVITKSGSLYIASECGTGNFVHVDLPQGTIVKNISIGYSHYCFVTSKGKVYAMNETQKTLRLLTPSFFNYANINRVFCGYNTVTYFSEKTIFTSCSRFLVYREVDVYPSNTKILSAHLSLQTYAVTHDEHVYVKRQKGVFTKTNDLPTIGKSETIVALGTQYDEEILIICTRKGVQLHANWQFDDIDFI